MNLSGSYKVAKIIKTRTRRDIDLNRAKRTTEAILEELSKTRNEVFNFTTFVSSAYEGEVSEIGVGSTFLSSLVSVLSVVLPDSNLASIGAVGSVGLLDSTVCSIETVVDVDVNPP